MLGILGDCSCSKDVKHSPGWPGTCHSGLSPSDNGVKSSFSPSPEAVGTLPDSFLGESLRTFLTNLTHPVIPRRGQRVADRTELIRDFGGSDPTCFVFLGQSPQEWSIFNLSSIWGRRGESVL